MRVKIIIDKDVTDWTSKEDWESMNDGQIISFVNGDLLELMEGSVWEITREG